MSEVKDNRAVGNGIGFFTILFFIFLVLKLTEVIDWSWWWVTSPLWLPWLVFLVVATIGGIGYGLYKAVEIRRGPKV